MLQKDKDSRNILLMRWVMYYLIGIVVGLLAIGIVAGLFKNGYGNVIENLENNGFSYIEILSIQVSVSFIVISIVTVFAQKNIIIYWEDVMYYKLIRPYFTNFCALSSYIIVDLLMTIVLICINSDYVYITFLLSILFITFLSLRMLEAFFMKELIQKDLEKKYEHSKLNRRDDRKSRDLYREYKGKTIQYTLQAIESGDIDTVCENAVFLYKNDETEDMSFLVDRMVELNNIYMLSRIVKESRFIFSDTKNIDEYSDLCKNLLKDGLSAARFVKSIFRSIGEHIVYESADDKKEELIEYFTGTLEDIKATCVSLGYKDIADEMEKNFSKQTSNLYDKVG